MYYNYFHQIAGSDLKDINIIAFRRMNQLDLSGNIITLSEYLPSLKVLNYQVNLEAQRPTCDAYLNNIVDCCILPLI